MLNLFQLPAPKTNLSSSVLAWWVLGGKQHEFGVSLDGLLGLGNKQFSVVIQELNGRSESIEIQDKSPILNTKPHHSYTYSNAALSLSFSLSIGLSLSISLSVCLCQSVCLVSPFVSLSLFFSLSLSLSVHFSLCLSV